MSVFKSLFIIVDNDMSIFQFDEINNSFDNISYMGEYSFNVSNFSWEWWENSVAFNSKKDISDFCFIADNPNMYDIKCDIKKLDTSTWNMTDIIYILSKVLNINKISLKNVSTGECYISNKINNLNLFIDIPLKVSSYNKDFLNDDKQSNLKDGLIDNNVDLLKNPLANYFVDLKNNQLCKL